MIEGSTLLTLWVANTVVLLGPIAVFFGIFKFYAYPRMPHGWTLIPAVIIVVCLTLVLLLGLQGLRVLIVVTLDYWGVPWFRQ